MLPMDSHSKYSLGRVVVTENASRKLSRKEIIDALCRHLRGDWGDLAQTHQPKREHRLLEGCRLLSAYRSAEGLRFWIITEADRSRTRILLPEDFA